MTFVHEDRDFDALLRIVADKRRIALGLVEKDYWVTHALWALQDAGFEIWFKGGTSLSKGFGLIERFSEDLDLKLEPGRVAGIPPVTDWKRGGKSAVEARRVHFEALARSLAPPGMTTRLVDDVVDEAWRSANIQLAYPARHLGELSDVLRPFVLLEVGSARVTPSVARDMTSFVHDELVALGQLDSWLDNRPRRVRCVHPLVTLLEKLDAIARRATNLARTPATFVRHYEDAARIIEGLSGLPVLEGYAGARELEEEMVRERQVKPLSGSASAILVPVDAERGAAIEAAFEAISPMYWGPRRTLEACRGSIRAWLAAEGFI